MSTQDEVPKEFFDLADKFIHLANSLEPTWPRSRISATMMYAAARFNAYNQLFSEVNPHQTDSETADYYTQQYRDMFLDNLEELRKSYKASGDLK
jgi:hypothetical protein